MLTESLQLNERVELLPVLSFPESVRERLSGEDSDFILSERGSRLRSQRINAETASLLRRFQAPRRVVDALVEHARERGEDPEVLLEEAFPLISELHAHGLLVAASAARADVPTRWAIPIGADVLGFRVRRQVRALTDTEVYKAGAPDGRFAAVKVVKRDAPVFVHEALAHEAEILRWAGARDLTCLPGLFGTDFDADSPCLVMEWRDGTDAESRARDAALAREGRGRLALAVVEAYASLHAAGLLHGDVQPNNILIDPAGRVSLVDFGGARLLRPDKRAPRRLALLHYAEPSVAAAHLAGRGTPFPTELGEQYAVAVVAYLLATGHPYLMLPLETDAAMRQIADTPPRAFDELGLQWPGVEAALMRALRKRSDERHEDMACFASRLGAALQQQPVAEVVDVKPARPVARAPAGRISADLEHAADELLRRYGLRGELIRSRFSRGPLVSVYYGAAGIAWALLRSSCILDSPDALAAADVWTRWGLSVRSSPSAFTGEEIGLSAHRVGPASILNAEPGLHVVHALVRHAAGDDEECRVAVRAFLHCVRQVVPREDAGRLLPRFPSDFATGTVGMLQGASLLLSVRSALSPSEQVDLLDAGRDLERLVGRELDLIEEDAGRTNPFLGFAHGRAGALFAWLAWRVAVSETGAPRYGTGDLLPRLRRLASLADFRGDTASWPLREGSAPGSAWPGWCHGSAGHLLLWTRASRLFEGEGFERLAEGAARHVWAVRTGARHSLCCGLAGMGLALLVHADASDREPWHERGRDLVRQSLDIPRPPVPHSLFRGEVGVMLAALEAQRPADARWPVCSPI